MVDPTFIEINIYKESEPQLFFSLEVPLATTPYETTNLIVEKLLEPAYRHCVLLSRKYEFMNYVSESNGQIIPAASHDRFHLGHPYRFYVRRVDKLEFFYFG